MTSARTPISADLFLNRIGYAFKEAARWTLKGLLAIAIVFMAGVIAVITAAAGLFIAAHNGQSRAAPRAICWW